MAKKFNLAALVPEMEAVSNSDTPRITMIPITELRPNGGNFYDTSNIADLVDSIELNGLLEPLCVFRRAQGTGSYVIFSGHRRYLALHLLYKKDRARWNEVPCIVYPDPHDANRETVMLIHANSTHEYPRPHLFFRLRVTAVGSGYSARSQRSARPVRTISSACDATANQSDMLHLTPPIHAD